MRGLGSKVPSSASAQPPVYRRVETGESPATLRCHRAAVRLLVPGRRLRSTAQSTFAFTRAAAEEEVGDAGGGVVVNLLQIPQRVVIPTAGRRGDSYSRKEASFARNSSDAIRNNRRKMELLSIILFIASMLPFSASNRQGDALYDMKLKLNASGDQLSDWNQNQVSPCTWNSVICDNNNNVVQVTLASRGFTGVLSPRIGELEYLNVLSLAGNNITGVIPEQFGNLSRLTSLDLEDNLLIGPIPASLGRLSKLQLLILSQNNLNGSIPDTLANISSLTDIRLAYNKLSGQLPPQLFQVARYASSNRSGLAFCRLLSLQKLDLSNNKLTGELPNCWWQMQALQFMDLSNNYFSGGIPKAPAGHNCSLESLHLASNSFVGGFPSVVGGCQKLVTLDIGSNRFFGGIPLWIGSGVPTLKILSLRSNNFTGEIPSELSQLSQLQLLDLSNNSLTGVIPREFGNLTSMKDLKIKFNPGSLHGSNYQDRIDLIWKGHELIFVKVLELMTGIDLSSNSLSRCIPEELTDLKGLRFLNLSRNHLSCSIPENIGSFKYLESLDLSLNELSGAIPQSMSNLQSLNTLNLSNNHFSGKIPTGNQLQTLNDASIYSNNSGLCGPPLDIPCTDPSLAFDQKNGEECQDQWLSYCVIAGIVFGFWIWYGIFFFIPKLRYCVFLYVDCMEYRVMQKLQPINRFLSKENSGEFL